MHFLVKAPKFGTCIENHVTTRRSVEHSTPHANGALLHFTGLSYIF